MTAVFAAASYGAVSPTRAPDLLSELERLPTVLRDITQIDGHLFEGAPAPIGKRGGAENRRLGREQR